MMTPLGVPDVEGALAPIPPRTVLEDEAVPTLRTGAGAPVLTRLVDGSAYPIARRAPDPPHLYGHAWICYR